jgi:hypothetical protein
MLFGEIERSCVENEGELELKVKKDKTHRRDAEDAEGAQRRK